MSTDQPPAGERPAIDFPGGLRAPAKSTGTHVDDSGVRGLPQSVFGYPEPNVPVIVSPGNQRKQSLGSERN